MLLPPGLFSLFAVAMLIAAYDDRRIASRERSTTGVIVSHEPQNHNSYTHQFHINGQEYAGSETPLKEEPKIGQSVTVYFDPLDPRYNSLTDFAELADTWRARGIVVLGLCAVFVAGVVLLDLTVGRARPKH